MDYVHLIITMNRKSSLFIVIFFYSQLVFAFWPNVSAPPQSNEIELADEIYVNGVALRIRSFTSRLSPREVLSFYRNKWNDNFAESVSGPWQQISRIEDKYFITVQVQDNGYSGSQGRISISEAPKKKPEVGKDIPMMNGTQILNEVITKDKYSISTVILLLNTFSAEDNLKFYEELFKQTGWKTVLNKNLEEKGISLVFKKESDEITITVNVIPEGTSILMNKVEKRNWFN